MKRLSIRTAIRRLRSYLITFATGEERKGKTYRFLCAIDGMGFLIYKTKTAMKKKTSTVWGINPECDDWFSKAEYIGLDLEEKE